MDERPVKRWNNAMKIKGITDEDFINYKVPSMYIATATCSFKCDWEYGNTICQNGSLADAEPIYATENDIINRYLQNPITHAIIFSGLEPIDQLDDLIAFIATLRMTDGFNCHDDVVIYTGYTKEEMEETECLEKLAEFDNIVVKFGRFIPGQEPHFDEVLGVNLASNNQHAERIS